MTSRLHTLSAAGQSLWLDYIDRTMLANGDLARRIRDDALTGMTSNPTIFEKALAEGDAYDAQLATISAGTNAREAFELVATTDVRNACDAFRGVYDATNGADGFVSIEVSPDLARDAERTINEARRLWMIVARPNLMIKVPGTEEGAVAVKQLISEGINVNITLLFAVEAHARVIEAYLAGLETRVQGGQRVDRIASVASFFVSRVDTAIDKLLEARAKATSDDAIEQSLNTLRGHAAIANAKRAYQLFAKSFSGARWDALASHGARVQRPLWASTGTKNPAYSDVLYVEELIGPDTVNTLPPATLDAFRDHGEVRRSVDVGIDEAERVLAQLAAHDISLDEVTSKLLADGLASFEQSFVTLLAGLEKKRAALTAAKTGATVGARA